MTASETLLDLHPTASALDARNDALRDLRTVAPGIVPFGLFLGVTVMVTGTDPFAGLFGAAFVYGGSAQLATITVLHLGSGLLAAVVSGVVVNARVLLYGAALEPWFRDQPLWFRVLGPQFVLDQTYLSAVERPGYRGASFRRYWFWLGTSILAAWIIAVAAGMALAPLLPGLPTWAWSARPCSSRCWCPASSRRRRARRPWVRQPRRSPWPAWRPSCPSSPAPRRA